VCIVVRVIMRTLLVVRRKMLSISILNFNNWQSFQFKSGEFRAFSIIQMNRLEKDERERERASPSRAMLYQYSLPSVNLNLFRSCMQILSHAKCKHGTVIISFQNIHVSSKYNKDDDPCMHVTCRRKCERVVYMSWKSFLFPLNQNYLSLA